MRHRPILQSRIVKKPVQYGIIWLLVTTFAFAVFFAAGGPLSLAGGLFATGVLAVVLDGLAFALYRKQRDAVEHSEGRVRTTTARRSYWYGLTTRATPRVLLGSVVVMVVVYVGLHFVVHLFFSLLVAWPMTSALRMTEHVVNAAFILYVLAVLTGTLSPHRTDSRLERLPLVVALVLLISTQLAIQLS